MFGQFLVKDNVIKCRKVQNLCQNIEDKYKDCTKFQLLENYMVIGGWINPN